MLGLAKLHLGTWVEPPTDSPVRCKFSVSGSSVTLTLRDNPSDVRTFAEVFLRQAYLPLVTGLTEAPRSWVDVGAHIGLTALLFSAHFPDARGICIEPVTESVELLRENLCQNGLSCSAIQAAVADSDGTALVYKSKWWSSCTTTAAVRDGRFGNAQRPEHAHLAPEEKVATVTIDTVLARANLDTIDILKFDAEGAEAVVFGQPRSWMKRVRRIGLDLHSRYVDGPKIIAVMRSSGFRLSYHRHNLVVLDRESL